MPTSWLLLADQLPPKYQWARIQSNADWIVPISIALLFLLLIRGVYRRDAAELPAWLRWLLMLLRALALLGLLVLWLQPERRAESFKTYNSRVLLLIDTSRSMGQNDAVTAGSGNLPTRLEQVTSALRGSAFLAALRKTHDVAVFQFNNALEHDPLGTLRRLPEPAAASGGLSQFSGDRPGSPENGTVPFQDPKAEEIQWDKLAPAGTETRLGEALRQLLDAHWGGPLSGIVVFSDGGQNAGIAPDAAVDLAAEAGIPIFTVGLGSDRKPVHVGVYDLAAPTRVYPGDPYTVTGYLQAQGLAGKQVTVDLLSRDAETAQTAAQRGSGQVEDSRKVTLGGDGEVVPVKFQLTTAGAGRRTLCFRVQPPKEDRQPKDPYREAEVEIVDRKNHILLLAGGPSRDYQFLRALLFRDRSITLDVLLQTAQGPVSQEAHKIRDDFPVAREDMFAYDCVVAFDPDWRSLRPAQIDVLADWVSEQGGGLIVAAGPVHAAAPVGGWVQDPNLDKLRILYPVEFFRQATVQDTAFYATKEAWPMKFTRDGEEAEFLWLADTAAASQQAWNGFDGVFSVCLTRGPKAGARVLASFADPRAAAADKPPVYFAEQFYGSGRVFYMGSSEIWRLRRIDPVYFEQFYTKLIRHVSQGRLLRGSPHGSLLLKQQRYLLGSTIDVEARRLSDRQFHTLHQDEISLHVVRLPDGPTRTVVLPKDKDHAGNYKGQLSGLQPGEYRLELPLPDGEKERLTAAIQVVVPQLESENPQRNDVLLSEIARRTHARYYVGAAAAVDSRGPEPLASLLPDRTRTEVIPTDPNDKDQLAWKEWLLIGLCTLICTALCLEWLIRRLAKLA
ncbi:MAG: vWA domain-containing protein [Thermoguttaceae bacterium]